MKIKIDKPVIDFDEVMRQVKPSKEENLANIFNEVGYKIPETPPELKRYITWPHRTLYQEYLKWLRDNGIKDYHFL